MKTIIYRLKTELPTTITREELINFFLDEIQVKPSMYAQLTMARLLEAAKLAGKVVEGHSRLDIHNCGMKSLKDEKCGSKQIHDILEGDHQEIIRRYKSGDNVAEIAQDYRCSTRAIVNMMHRHNIKIRSGRFVKAHYITMSGITKTIGQWAEFFGISRSAFRYRYSHNFNFENLLKTYEGKGVSV